MKSLVKLGIVSILLAAVVLSAVSFVSAATKPKKRVVLGTTQLSGDQAVFGKAYTLGKTDPINVTLDRAEFTIEPVKFGNDYIYVNADQKFLVLHYTLHNPNKRDRGLAWSTININAVDTNDTNWRYATNVAMEATGEKCNMKLKPAQKTKVYTCIAVPAKAIIPKVIFESSDKLVLRYDLNGKVTPLPAPIADPGDKTGSIVLEKIPAQMGTFYTMKTLKCKIDSAEFVSGALANYTLPKGNRYLVINATAQNSLQSKASMGWGTFHPTIYDADGGEVRWDGQTFYGSRDESVNSNIEPGKELRFRIVFKVPEKVQLQSLELSQLGSHSYVFDLSGVK